LVVLSTTVWLNTVIFNDLKELKMITLTEEQLEEIVATAHMAGQQTAGVKTPKYYDAHLYYARKVKNNCVLAVVSKTK